MTAQSVQPLLSIGELCRLLGVPKHRIQYVLDSRHIEPVGRAGSSYVYSPAAFERIRDELGRIASERTP